MELLSLEKVLSDTLKHPARVVILGIGNVIRSDDFVGVAIVQALKKRVQKDTILYIEAEIAPSEFVPEILEWKPTHVLIIDAANLTSGPGTFNLIKREIIIDSSLSSHKRALTLLLDLLTFYLPDLKLFILGIKPVSVEYVNDLTLSQPIKDTIQRLTNMITPILKKL